MAACGFGDTSDCVQVVRDMKTVQIPCTTNKYETYTVKVPRQVTEQVPRNVSYTDFESRQKQVPYTVTKSEQRMRMETQKYQVPVTKHFTKVVMETRERQVPVPYFVNVPETKYRTVTEQVPVQKTKVEMDSVTKTVFDTQTKTRCVPETKMVTKQIPVFSVVPKPAPPCPQVTEMGPQVTEGGFTGANDYQMGEAAHAFADADTNQDNVISFNEFAAARESQNGCQ